MAQKKTTFKYHLKLGSRVDHRGITDDLDKRERDHWPTQPGTRIVQVGRRTTWEAALRWEREGGKRMYTMRRASRLVALAVQHPTQECGCQMCERHRNEPDDTPEDR